MPTSASRSRSSTRLCHRATPSARWCSATARELYWRLGEATGTTAVDASASRNNGTINGTVDLGAAGALDGLSDTAYTFREAGQGETGGHVVASQQASDPSVYTVSAAFRTTTTEGGKIIGFGNQPSGLSTSYDRHVFMQDDGTLVFGVWTGNPAPTTIASTESYRDGKWHQVVATQSAAGMALYVDGSSLIPTRRPDAQDYDGYWRIGGDSTWDSASPFFVGDIDEAFVLNQALTETQVAELYTTANLVEINDPPVADFTVEVDGLTVTVDGSGSTDDGTITDWTWDFDGPGTGDTTGESTTFTYDAAGTYTISLTVTDDNGQASDPATTDVTVSAIPDRGLHRRRRRAHRHRGRFRLHRRRRASPTGRGTSTAPAPATPPASRPRSPTTPPAPTPSASPSPTTTARPAPSSASPSP